MFNTRGLHTIIYTKLFMFGNEPLHSLFIYPIKFLKQEFPTLLDLRFKRIHSVGYDITLHPLIKRPAEATLFMMQPFKVPAMGVAVYDGVREQEGSSFLVPADQANCY